MLKLIKNGQQLDHSLKEKKLKKKSVMYVPIIENVTRIVEDKTSWVSKLIIYNLLFLDSIVPL